MNPAEHHGIFVCLEGIDCSGKTTAANMLARALSGAGLRACVIQKRTLLVESAYRQAQLDLLSAMLWRSRADDPIDQFSSEYWLFLLAAWHDALFTSCVVPARERGDIVIVDGWWFRYAARFRLKPGFDSSLLSTCFGAIGRPDLIFFVDVAPDVAALRKTAFSHSECCDVVSGLSDTSRNSFIAFQTRVRTEFSRLPEWDDFSIVNAGDRPAASIVSEVLTRIDGHLECRRRPPSIGKAANGRSKMEKWR
jgi:thymidylate kinase